MLRVLRLNQLPCFRLSHTIFTASSSLHHSLQLQSNMQPMAKCAGVLGNRAYQQHSYFTLAIASNASVRSNNRSPPTYQSKRFVLKGPTNSRDGLNDGSRSWPLPKKLLVLWSGAILAIGSVLLLNEKFYVEKTSEAERMKKLERVKGDWSVSKYLLTIPCMRNTAMLAIILSFTSWVTGFLLTSNPAVAFRAMWLVPSVVGPCYFTYCKVVTDKERKESEQITSALKDLQRYKEKKKDDIKEDIESLDTKDI